MATSGSKSVTVTQWDTLKFSWEVTSQSVVNNTSTVNWKLQLISTDSGRIDSSALKNWSVTINGKTFSGTNTVGIANNTTKTLASGTTTIAHNTNGTKTFSYSFSQQFSITFSGTSIGTKSGSGSGTLDTIARKSGLTASNGTLGTAQTLTVTRYDSGFTHTITYKCGSASGTIVTKASGTSVSFTPPLTLASQNTKGTTVSITLTITTYTGDTSIGTNSVTITCGIPSSVKPSVSLAVTDAAGHFNTFGAYVRGQSKFKVVLTESGSYGSTITARKTTADGKTYTAASFTSGVVSGSGTLTISTTVTDSRGRTATASTTVSVLAYSQPKISSLTVNRCDASGNSSTSGAYLKVTFGSAITALNNKNAATYSVQYKKTGAASYTTKTLTNYSGQYSVSGGSFVFAAETASSYNIVFTISDAFTSAAKTATGSSIKKLWSALSKGLGWAFGKVAELENVLDIAFQTRHLGGFLHPVLEANTDLNDVVIPNTYISNAAGAAGYSNCPVASGTFSLLVEEAGTEGQIRQRLTTCSKTASRIYERFFYQGTWGGWLCVSDMGGKVLWSGTFYMQASHVINLAEPISKQPSGVVFVWSWYNDGSAVDSDFHYFFVPKYHVANFDGQSVIMSDYYAEVKKTLYVSDTQVKGYLTNGQEGTDTLTGLKYNNKRLVLRAVIGV